MFVQQITGDETGTWAIRTASGQVLVLYVPADRRARVEWLGNTRELLSSDPAAQEPFACELVAFGRFGLL
ncbi:hypothetical protein [Cellulomonas sp. NPDC058312]|uniref:hypothetical protein n=1 Tax=Cellulomonas sp. NPDC058312 TaxID=3346441 RepID=UPI0036E679AF